MKTDYPKGSFKNPYKSFEKIPLPIPEKTFRVNGKVYYMYINNMFRLVRECEKCGCTFADENFNYTDSKVICEECK